MPLNQDPGPSLQKCCAAARESASLQPGRAQTKQGSVQQTSKGARAQASQQETACRDGTLWCGSRCATVVKLRIHAGELQQKVAACSVRVGIAVVVCIKSWIQAGLTIEMRRTIMIKALFCVSFAEVCRTQSCNYESGFRFTRAWRNQSPSFLIKDAHTSFKPSNKQTNKQTSKQPNKR